MSIMFALLSSMLLGSADFAGGVAARRAPAAAITVWANAVGLVTALVVVLVLPAPLSLTDIGWGLLAGTCGSLGAVLLYRALALGVMSLVAPVTAASAAVIPVAVGAGLGERLSTPALVGVAGAVASMVLLCRRRQPAAPSPHTTPALIWRCWPACRSVRSWPCSPRPRRRRDSGRWRSPGARRWPSCSATPTRAASRCG